MALKFGPQWLRDLSDGGASTSQPSTPTMSVKFKLAEYRYGREEMLSLFNDNSPPPDQVRKHLPIFSKEIQKPITMSPLTEDEQRIVSQGFNSTVVLRAAGRGSGPPLRASRGGGTVDRSRGRGRGRGEGYILRPENGDVGYISRPTQEGWEHVGRKFERSFSRGYDESGTTKREFSRSSSDNWRDKRHDDEEEDEGGVTWRNTRETNNPRWGPSSRSNWREPQRDLQGFDGDRKPPPPRRGFDQDAQGPHRTSESYDNEGEVPEWVEDDVGDDPGTFDSSGAFVSTKEGRRYSDTRQEAPNIEGSEKKAGTYHPSHLKEHPSTSESLSSNINDKVPSTHLSEPVYIPQNSRNGTGDAVDSRLSVDQPKLQSTNLKGQPDSVSVLLVSSSAGSSNKGDGDSGFAFPNKEETNGTCAPPGQYTSTPISVPLPQPVTVQKSELNTRTRLADPDFLHMEKSLQNLVASMASDHRDGRQMDVSQGALPLTHENSNKWFYKDPQGEIQGPFTNEEMSQWFSAGFFTMSLVIKRGCDDSFKQLGELIKRYGRVPFLPGPPLPPLITSIPTEPSVVSAPPISIPSLVSTTSASQMVVPGLPSVPDPLILQHMILQQEYLKQKFLMRQMQLQTLHQMQEQDSFKSLSPDQQQHLSMQMVMHTNPVFMQHLQQLQQQQLLLQQQQLQEQQKVSQASVPAESNTISYSQPQPSISSATTATLTTNNNSGVPDKMTDDNPAWGAIQQYLMPGVWSQSAPQPILQPTSLWDIDTSNGTLSPAYLAQLDKIRRERKDDKVKEEERSFQDELEKKQEEIRRQQEDLERQRIQMRREMEELERHKQTESQKIEEARRQEEDRIQQEIERQREEKAEEMKRAEDEKKRQEDERKREHELKKQEDKKRKEEDKRRQQEEQKRLLAEMRRKKEEEILRQQEVQQQHELEVQKHQELLRQQQEEQLQQKEEEERMLREASERERLEAQKRQQYELQRQQESLRRLQQSQRDQLANIQLPASSNWAAQQQNVQGSLTQSRSLTEIQEEEARKELEMEREQQQQLQRMQEQVYLKNQQHQQKSWATQMSQGVPTKGVSLLDIQQQEQENAKRSQKEKPSTQTYQAKLSLASASTWTGSTSAGTWSNQPAWNSGFPNTAAVWDQVANLSNRKSAFKESGEFPALKNQSQQTKKNSDKSTKTKVSGAKQKKEEESVQKLFQTRQQDDFSHWVMEIVSQFCAPIDVPTFVSFIVEVDSPDDVKEYMKTYLGDTKESRDFARQFVEKRNYFRNQARLEKQQEEDSIWGPAPAVNPHNQMRGGGGGVVGGGTNSTSANDSGEGGSGKGKNRKKKQKMQKLDGSILGFTVHADPNRKHAAGEVESIQ